MGRKVKLVELGEVCEIWGGLSIPSKEQFSENISTDLRPMLRVQNFNNHSGIKVDKCVWINPLNFPNSEKCLVGPGEIMMARWGSAGKIALNNTSSKLYFSKNICKINPKSEIILQKYLFYALLINQKKINSSINTGPIPALNLAKVKKIKIPLPPLEQQEKIAKWLDTFSSLERQLERHKTQYRYYLNRLMRGGRLTELGSLCEFQRGVYVPIIKQFKEKDYEDLCPIIKIKNFHGSGIKMEDFNWIDPNILYLDKKFICHPSEIMIARSGSTAGKLAINNLNYGIYFSESIYKLLPNGNSIHSQYLFYALLSQQEKIDDLRTSGPIPELRIPRVKKLQVPLPSLDKQEKIANWLDRFRELTDNISKGLPREILLLKQQSRYYREKLIN